MSRPNQNGGTKANYMRKMIKDWLKTNKPKVANQDDWDNKDQSGLKFHHKPNATSKG